MGAWERKLGTAFRNVLFSDPIKWYILGVRLSIPIVFCGSIGLGLKLIEKYTFTGAFYNTLGGYEYVCRVMS